MLISVTTPSYQWSEYLDFRRNSVSVVVVISGIREPKFSDYKADGGCSAHYQTALFLSLVMSDTKFIRFKSLSS